MTLATELSRGEQAAASRNGGPAPSPPGIRRRAGRTAVVGLLVAVAASLTFVVVDLRADPASAVLALARPVPAGQVITDADLRVARVVPDPGVPVMLESQRRSVVGHRAAVPLLTGTYLTPNQLGAAAWPPPNQAVIAVAVKPGHAPTGMAPGSLVTVLVVPAASAAGNTEPAAAVQSPATVVSIAAATNAGVTVVSLLLTSPSALKVSSATGDVSLILQGTGG
jgi:hypothetical protein